VSFEAGLTIYTKMRYKGLIGTNSFSKVEASIYELRLMCI